MLKFKFITLYIVFFCAMASGLMAQNFAFNQNKKLGKGINLGNALEAPNEGEWGVTLQENYFRLIAEKGFNSVRIPVRWSAHALSSAPYTINETFFKRVDWAINNALKNKLMVIVNFHHYEEIFQNPASHKLRFLTMWSQVARRYAHLSDSVIFEPLNEPHDKLTPELWNQFLSDARDTIRKSNPGKTILVGIAEYGGIGGLNKLLLPNDTNLILTVHYYNPFNFTHQGASWVSGSNEWLGTGWHNRESERDQIKNEFEAVRSFANKHNIPINVGEFGAFSQAAEDSRVRWTNFCARYFDECGYSWNYWEFCSGFGIYNPSNNTWRQGLVDALLTMPMPEPFVDPSGNMLFNGNFNFGKTNWSTYIQSPASATFNVTGGKAVVTISNGSNTDYHVQLMAFGLNMVKGKTYRIEFNAYASKTRSANVSIAKNGSPYTSYFFKTIDLGITDKKYSYQFTMQNETDNMARFLLNLGANTGTIYVGNVFITEAGTTGMGSELKPTKTRFFPNPANESFMLEMQDLSAFSIYNGNGQLVHKKSGISENKVLIDCTSFAKGLYLVRATDRKGYSEFIKVLVGCF
jgi:endoglucanase